MKKPADRALSGSGVTMVPRIRGRSSRLSPPSCAAIMRAVRPVVANRPNSAHPAQSISAGRESGCLRLEDLEDTGEGLLEGCYALVLEPVSDRVHVDAHGRQVAQALFGIGDATVKGALRPAVHLERVHGLLRK